MKAYGNARDVDITSSDMDHTHDHWRNEIFIASVWKSDKWFDAGDGWRWFCNQNYHDESDTAEVDAWFEQQELSRLLAGQPSPTLPSARL